MHKDIYKVFEKKVSAVREDLNTGAASRIVIKSIIVL